MADEVVDHVKVRVSPDTGRFRSELRAQLAKVNETVNVDVQVDVNTFKASRTLQAWKARQSGQEIEIRADVNTLGKSLGHVTGMFSGMGKVAAGVFGKLLGFSADAGSSMTEMGAQGVTGMNKTAGAIASVISGIAQMAAQSLVFSTVILGVAGVVQAAIGGIAAGLAGLPVLIGALGVPLLTVFLGMDRLKAMFGQLTSAVNVLKTAVGNAFETHFAQSIPKIRTLLLGLEGGLVNIATKLSQFANGIVNVVTSSQGLRDVQSMLQGVGIFLDRMAPGVARFVQESLRIAGTKELYRILGDTVRGVTNELAGFLQKARESGVLTSTLRGIRDMATAATKMVGALGFAGMQFLSAAAPGITAFFRQLGNFFSRFNWDMLGKSFGGVFSSIANWLNNIPREALTALQNAMTHLGDAIKRLIDSGALNIMLGLFTSMIEAAAYVADGIAWIIEKAQSLVNFTKGFIPGYEAFGGVIERRNEGIKRSSGAMSSTFGGHLLNMANRIRGTGTDFNNLKNNATRNMNATRNNASAAARGIADAVGRGTNDAANRGTRNFGRLPNGIRRAGPGARNAAVGVGQGVANAMANRSWVSRALSAGAAIARGIGEGIASAAQWVWNQAKSLMSGIASFFPHSPAKEGPFSGRGYTPHSGRALVRDFGRGMLQEFTSVNRQVRSQMGLLRNQFAAPVEFSVQGNAVMAASVAGPIPVAANAPALSREETLYLAVGSMREDILDAVSGWVVDVNEKKMAKRINEINIASRRR